MSKQFNNKMLLYVSGALILLLIFTLLIRIPREKATIKDRLIVFDSIEVNKIVIYPKLSKNNPIEFNKNNGKWTVKQGQIVSSTQKDAVQNMMNEVLSIKPQSLAAKDKSKWKEFELTDSLSTTVRFINKKDKTLADLMVGKFSYKESANPYGGNGVQGTSYVRLSDQNEVYGVDGFLSFFFSVTFNDWRDKSFINSNKNDITSVNFSFPSDSSYILSKKDSGWYAGSEPADSAIVAGFLNTLSSLNGQDFKDNFKPSENPQFQILVTGNNMLNFLVKCYKEENSYEYILNSSQNPDVYFTSKVNEIFEQLFKPRSYFIGKKGKK
jgi:hypothetical protein